MGTTESVKDHRGLGVGSAGIGGEVGGISSSELCVRFTNEAKFGAGLEGGARARARPLREIELEEKLEDKPEGSSGLMQR